jgi:hypothetical protein
MGFPAHFTFFRRAISPSSGEGNVRIRVSPEKVPGESIKKFALSSVRFERTTPIQAGHSIKYELFPPFSSFKVEKAIQEEKELTIHRLHRGRSAITGESLSRHTKI